MKGIVWGYTFNSAQEKLKEIAEDYKTYEIAYVERILQHYNQTKIEFSNGDIWYAIAVSESQRGFRCNISYIDSRIDEEIVNCIIKKCTIAGPYHGITYYNI